MVGAAKCALAIFMLLGIALLSYAALQMLSTRSLVATATGTAKAQFAGYHREEHRRSALLGSSPPSITRYPEFTYRAQDGTSRKVREPHGHVFELYREGQEVDIMLLPHAEPRLAGFFSLYLKDLVVLLMGLGLLALGLVFWTYGLPALTAPHAAGSGTLLDAATAADAQLSGFLDKKIGPFSVKAMLVASGAFMAVALIAVLAAALLPYLAQMRFGAGGRLMDALREQRFDEAREMIAKGQGINAVNEYNQNALLIALEAGRMDLAAMLMRAGADVNIRSKMLMTPLRAAVDAGDLETVKLLLGKGALPQHPDDKVPPLYYALAEGREDIARALVEAGSDLHRLYTLGSETATVGDMAVIAGRQTLVDLIRQRGGTFTQAARR